MAAIRIRTGWSLLAFLIGAHATGLVPADVEEPISEPLRIAFAPAEGTRLRKTFTRELELTTREGDSEIEVAAWRDWQKVVLVDEVGPLEGQIPETITRSFESVAMEHSHEWKVEVYGLTGDVDRRGTGEIVGSRVEFTRDRTETETPLGLHEASYVAELVDDSELPGESGVSLASLRASTDSTGLLPWHDVAIADAWFTDVDAFREICWPGGELVYVDAEGERLVVPVDERLGRNLDGTFRIELDAVERVDGVRFARMTFHGTLESRATFSYEWIFELAFGGFDGTFAYEGSITLDLEASLRGRFWWNLDAGHLDSIHVEGDVTIEQSFGEDRWGRGNELVPGLIGTRVWSGRLCAEADFERL